MSASLRPTVVLTVICVVCASLLAGAQSQLGERVERQIDLFVRGPALERLFDVPAAEILNNKVIVSVGGVTYPVFYLLDGDEPVRLAIEATGAGGHGGDIVMLIGIDLDTESLLGMDVVSHSETPGLGARIVEPAFRSQWEGLAAAEPVALAAEGGAIDALTGATITSRAALRGTNRVVELIASHRDQLLEAIAAQRAADREGGS